jgi:hypothetical protein
MQHIYHYRHLPAADTLSESIYIHSTDFPKRREHNYALNNFWDPGDPH